MESRPAGDPFLPGEEARLGFVSAREEISAGDGSESGWTVYLDHSLESFRISKTNEYDEPNVDSNSMVSDASSGPRIRPDLPREVRVSNPGTTKRRRIEPCDHLGEDPSLLEDTASSPVHSPKSEATAGEADAKEENSRTADCVSELEAEAVNRRLGLLQSLLPDGAKICREEALGVAIEYIVGLEQRIEKLQAEAAGGNRDYRRDQGSESGSGALFRRGLCLIPFSMAAGMSRVQISGGTHCSAP